MTPWARATLALQLFAVDPQILGGLTLRARVSPARDAFVRAASKLSIPSVRLHPHISTRVLDGDIDLSATLSGGTLVMQRGLLDRPPSLFILPMAERIDPQLAARLCAALDAGRSHALLALDEGAEAQEALPAALSDRMAFSVALSDVSLADVTEVTFPDNLETLRRKARKIDTPESVLQDLVALAVSLGITSLRAPSFALSAAQIHAAMDGRNQLTDADVAASVALVYAHRATQLPQEPEAEAETPEQDTKKGDSQNTDPSDVLLEAVKATLPPDILAELSTKGSKRATGAGAGTKRIGNRKGRPLPARDGPKRGNARVDLIATLRAAIPMQTLRRRYEPDRKGAIIRHSDLRQKRYETHSDRLLIFTVDASGSAAMSRLAEAKGAVELLLAQAYARRDHVALISFRGAEAELLLPPTRSLVQTKQRLAAIPGGGATPLAAGMSEAMSLAQHATQKGLSPTIVLLADGRANVALDSTPNRNLAARDAQSVARKIAGAQIQSLLIDTTNRPEKALSELAMQMRAKYIPLPRADAQRVSSAISASLDG